MIIKNLNVRFKEWDCVVFVGVYESGRIALQLFDAKDMEPVATATVNLPDAPLEEYEVLIKDYSENEGMVDALVKAGLVTDTTKRVPTGFAAASVCQLTPWFKKKLAASGVN